MQETVLVDSLHENFFHAAHRTIVFANPYRLARQAAVLSDEQHIVLHALLGQRVKENVVGEVSVVGGAVNFDEPRFLQDVDIFDRVNRQRVELRVIGIFFLAVIGIVRQLHQLQPDALGHDYRFAFALQNRHDVLKKFSRALLQETRRVDENFAVLDAPLQELRLNFFLPRLHE